MQVVYDESFNSLLKACILKEVKGYDPVTEATLDSKEFTSVNDYQLNQLFIEWDWVNGTPHNVSGLETAINFALRHRVVNKELLFKVISQALKRGVDYVLTRRSFEAKRFCNQVLAVREELRNAKLNMKFTRDGDTLLGRYLFSHDIADLLLEFYQKRFPEKQVVIINQVKAYSLQDSKVKVVPAIRTPLVRPMSVSAPSPVTLSTFF